jgi:hypothetical protein
MAEKWWEWLMEMYLSSLDAVSLIHRNTNPNHCNPPLAIFTNEKTTLMQM